jgi:hypothetical protein
MNLDRYLASTQYLDCQGQVTHTLTLLPDGRVRVDGTGFTAHVDPRTRVVHPRGLRLPDQLLDHAATLAREALDR